MIGHWIGWNCHWLGWKLNILSLPHVDRPAHYAIAQLAKLIAGKGFCKHIGNLFEGLNMFNGDSFMNNTRTIMM